MNDMIDETVKLLRTLGHEVDEAAVEAMKGYCNELVPVSKTPLKWEYDSNLGGHGVACLQLAIGELKQALYGELATTIYHLLCTKSWRPPEHPRHRCTKPEIADYNHEQEELGR